MLASSNMLRAESKPFPAVEAKRCVHGPICSDINIKREQNKEGDEEAD